MFGGRYRIVTALGRGAVGEIFRAQDTWHASAPVAIKLATLPATKAKARALESEFRILREITHPHIVEAYDFGWLPDGRPFLTMEYIEGRDTISAWPDLLPAERIGVLLKTCLALRCIHASGYVHGDLKAENLLVCMPPGPTIKLVDFGHAAIRDTRDLQLRGTPAYMAPEVLTGASVDARSDLYALGVLIFRLISGRFPFGTGAAAVRARISRPVPPLVPDPELGIEESRQPALVSIVDRLLAQRPEQRPADAEQLARELERISHGPVRDRSPSGRLARTGGPIGFMRAPFVGRRTILACLDRTLRKTLQDGGLGVVVLAGAPGMGKSRIMEEFKTHCQLRGCLVLSILCAPEPGSQAGETSLSRLLERICDALPPEAETVATCGAELLKVAPKLGQYDAFSALAARVKFREAGARPLPPRQERLRHWDQIGEFLVRQSRRVPLVLCFQEANHSDEGLQSLAGALSRRTESGPILVCFTTISTEAQAWLARSREIDARTTHLRVSGLSAGEIQELVRAMLAQGLVGTQLPRAARAPRRAIVSIARALGQRLHRLTKGNPSQILALIRSLSSAGDPAAWTASNLPKLLPVPEGLTASMRRRLRAMSPAAARMLRYIAHASRPVPEPVLMACWRRRSERSAVTRGATAELAKLVEAGLAVRRELDTEVRWDLVDQRHSEVITTITRRTEHRVIHRELAMALQRYGLTLPSNSPRRPQLLEQQAHHLLEAGETERGVRYSLRAAREARRLYAYRHALALLRSCLRSAGRLSRAQPPVPRRIRQLEVDVLCEMADLAGLLGDTATEEKILRRLRSRACSPLLGRVERARVERRQGSLAMIQGRHPDAARFLTRARRLLDEEGGRRARGVAAWRERLRVAATTAMLHIHRGESDVALSTCEDALRAAESAAEVVDGGEIGAEIASLLNYSAIAHLYRGDAGDVLHYWAGAHRAYRLACDPVGMAGVLNNLGKFHMDRGDLRRARTALRRAVAQRQRLSDLDGVADSLNNLGIIEIMGGRAPHSRRLLEKGSYLRRRVGDRFGEMLSIANLAEVDLLEGRYGAAEEKLERALDFMRAAGHARLCRGLSNSLAAAWLATGRVVKSAQLLRRIAAEAATSGDRLQEGIARTHLGYCALEQYRMTQGQAGTKPSRRRLRSSRLEVARHLFEEALVIFEDLPHRYHQGLAIIGLIQVRQAEDTLCPSPGGRSADLQGGDVQGGDVQGEDVQGGGVQDRDAQAREKGKLSRIADQLGSVSLKAWDELLRGIDFLQICQQVKGKPPGTIIEAASNQFDRALDLARSTGLREIIWQAHLGSARSWRLAQRNRRAHNHLREGLATLAVMQSELHGNRLRASFLKSGGRSGIQREIHSLAKSAGLQVD
ncbi:MAG: protein kinase [Candidatus Eisenbacteria sp.]|nr:protein kinase [Candidatus Eisenbacteria bacterium]